VDAKSVKRRGVLTRMKDVASDDTATSILADSEFTCDRNTSFAKHPGKDTGSKAALSASEFIQ